jgi:hypothetical protein
MRKKLLFMVAASLLFAIPSPAAPQAEGQKPQPAAGESPITLRQSPAAEAAMRESGCCNALTRQNDLAHQVVRTYYLANVSRPTEMQDVVNGMRTILEFQRVQPIPALHAIVVRGNPEQIAAAEKLIRDIDKPRGDSGGGGSYRLDFALHEVENGKRVSTHAYSMMVQRGNDNHDAEWSRYRVGSRVPVTTGSSPAQTQYMDIGVNIECRVWGVDEVLLLENTVELSSLAALPNAAPDAHPVVRQLKATSLATVSAGKPTVIGSLDGVDSARRTEVEVTATRVK